MFNTLELVSSLAMRRRTDDTVQVIEDLGKMMRFSMNTSDDRVLLAEELAYVRHYISILQTRFGHKLDISIHEEGRLDSLVMIKFILRTADRECGQVQLSASNHGTGGHPDQQAGQSPAPPRRG